MAPPAADNLNTVLLIIRDYALEKELGALKLEKSAVKGQREFWYVAAHDYTGNPEEDKFYRVVWERGDVIQRLIFDRDFFAVGDLMNLVTIYGGRVFSTPDLATFKGGKDPLFEKRKQSYDTPF
ncbi:MAG: hypothetical protein ACYS8W_18145 [Planctomycetota bacterium]|jgi:hypothetical protein